MVQTSSVNKFAIPSEKCSPQNKEQFHTSSEGKRVQLISDNVSKLTIDAVDGKSIFIKDGKKIFKAGIQPYFRRLKINMDENANSKTSVGVYELIEDSTLMEIFSSFPNHIDDLCLTQHQILNFCTRHPEWLGADGQTTFFITKLNKEHYVIYLYMYSAGPYAYICPLDNYLCHAKYKCRFVVPSSNI